MNDQPAHRVELAGIQLRSDLLVEFLDPHLGADQYSAVVLPHQFRRLLGIVFVADLAHDLLQDVFNREQPGGPAVLVHDHGEMIAATEKLVQQGVQALGFGNQRYGPQQRLDFQRAFRRIRKGPQHVLGQQTPDHLVAVLADDRET